MKITFNQQTVGVKTHPEDDSLYCLNDLHKASGGMEKQKPTHFSKTIRGKKSYLLKIIGKGKAQGTYADEKTVYKYAAWIDDSFYDAVFDCFKAAASGEGLKASLIANTVAIPQSLITETKKVERKMKELVAKAAAKGHIKMQGHEVSNYSRLAQRSAAGYASKQLTNGCSTFIGHVVSEDHKPALSAYKATLELMVMLLAAGAYDYHTIASALKVTTSKNKEVFRLAEVA